MKIIFFIDSLRGGGKERRLTELMKSLKLNPAIEFELVVMNEEIHYTKVFDLNIKIHYLIRKTKKDLSVFRKFYDTCKSFRPDLVHCWNSMTAVIAVPSCKLLNIPLINGMVIDTPVKRTIFNKDWLRAKLSFPFSDKIIGNSRSGLIAYGAPSKKSCCIYNGVDLTRFRNLQDPNILNNEIFGIKDHNLFIAGMVAAFEPRKDYKTFITAALSLVDLNESIRFILVGDGSDFLTIKKSVPSKFSDKIIFLGKKSNVESIVNLFDVGVLLTNSKVHGEGVSNSIIEYMALGKPVIATRGGGTNEVVINNQNGYLINADDSSELINCIQILIKDRNLRTKLGARSAEMAQRMFDLKMMTQNYTMMYQQVLKRK